MSSLCNYCQLNVWSVDPMQNMAVEFTVNGETHLWCGWCRDGSKEYFGGLESDELIYLINTTAEILDEMGDGNESIMSSVKKVWLDNEVDRAKRELMFRVAEA